MGKLNVANRTLFTYDNLPVMRGINSETIDLIYLDPPFNSKRNYATPIGSQAAGAAFKDTWSLDDIKKEWVEEIEADNKSTWAEITSAGHISGESTQAYLQLYYAANDKKTPKWARGVIYSALVHKWGVPQVIPSKQEVSDVRKYRSQ